jgi:16S rRNA processing protein RimM
MLSTQTISFSLQDPCIVIPAQAGIQGKYKQMNCSDSMKKRVIELNNRKMDPRFREDDKRDSRKERSDMSNQKLLSAAIITAAHGIQGHVKVKCFLENPGDFEAYSPFSNEKGEKIYKINKILSQNKDILIVSFEGIKTRTEAEQLKGKTLMVAREHLPKLLDDTFYHADLIELSVKSTKNRELGIVHRIFNFGAGDILEIKTQKNKLVMVPFTQVMVPMVNIQQGFVSLSPAGEAMVEREDDET